jgi:AraC-like DNA-binding protein
VAVVLDAASHPPAERADLVHDVIARSGARRRVGLNTPAESVNLRAEAWQMDSVQVLRTVGTGLTLARTAQDVRDDAPELLAVALSGGECTYSACGAARELAPNGIVLVDFSTPYVFAHVGEKGTSFTSHISYADLDLDVDDVRAAIPRLGSSAVLPLLRNHLVHLRAVMDEVAVEPEIATGLAAATIDLTRALVVSAGGGRRERDVLRETLRVRIAGYIRANLRDRDLTPARIAAAHHLSLRTLYNVWGDEDETLVDWIMRERLERVRRELGSSDSTVSAAARRWGFADPGHLSRRFRGAYGASPTEWMRRSRSTTGAP